MERAQVAMAKNPRECGTSVLLISLSLLLAMGRLLSLTLGPIPLRALALAWILLAAAATTGRLRRVAAAQLAVGAVRLYSDRIDLTVAPAWAWV